MAVLSYPVKDMTNNLLLTSEKEVIALYKVPSLSVAVVDDEKKEKIKEDVGRVLRKLAPQKEFEIALVPKDYRLVEKARDMTCTLADDALEIGRYTLNHMVKCLTDEMGVVYQYEWLICVWLKKQQITLNVKQMVYRKVEEMSHLVLDRLGYEIEDDGLWAKNFEAEEAEIYQMLSTLRVQRLSEEESFYYQRYQFLRYTKHERDEVVASRHLLNVTDSVIENLNGVGLKLQTPYGVSYISILPIGKMPTLLNYQHIAERLTQLNFPVEMRIKAEFSEVNGVNAIKGKMSRSRTRTKNIMQEAKSSGSSQHDRIVEGMFSLNDLEKQIGNSEPIITFGMYLIVSASNKKQLMRRKKSVITTFSNLKIEVSTASFDQPYLFQNTLFGLKLNVITKKWHHVATTRGLAEQMLFTTTSAGSHSGFYLGRIDNRIEKWDCIEDALVGSRNIALFNATIANKEGIAGKQTKNPHIMITGETGSGKSYLAQKIFIQTTLMNVKTLYVDPKAELRRYYTKCMNDPMFKKKYPLIAEHLRSFNYVTLNAKDQKNHGVLDPIVMLDSVDAVETAKNMISFLCGDKIGMEQSTAISKAIKKIVHMRMQGHTVGLMNVISLLQKHSNKEINVLGEYLFEQIDGSLLDLAFSDGNVGGLSYDKRVTILEVSGLTLPEDGTDKITEIERNSVVLMFALGNYCMRFGEMNPDEDTIEFFDESWILTKSAEGKKVVKSMRRVGRSKNNVLCLITQSVNDDDKLDDSTGFGTIFAFYERNEREDILKHMNLDVNERNLEWLDNMRPGQCLFKDVYGNLNRMTIHELMPGFHQLFSPMKDTKSSVIENKYS